jgi:hypothetical protein
MPEETTWGFDQTSVIKARCPECGPDRQAFVRSEHQDSYDFWFSEWESLRDAQ